VLDNRTLALITPTVPGREEMLKVALDSVYDEVRANRLTHFLMPGTDSAAVKYNRALTMAQTKGFTHYFLLSDDDFLVKGWLDAHMWGLAQQPGADFVYGDIAIAQKNGAPSGVWKPPVYDDLKLLYQPTLPGVGIISIDTWARAGGYRDVPYGADWLLFAHA
jgi:hypothetical protein